MNLYILESLLFLINKLPYIHGKTRICYCDMILLGPNGFNISTTSYSNHPSLQFDNTLLCKNSDKARCQNNCRDLISSFVSSSGSICGLVPYQIADNITVIAHYMFSSCDNWHYDQLANVKCFDKCSCGLTFRKKGVNLNVTLPNFWDPFVAKSDNCSSNCRTQVREKYNLGQATYQDITCLWTQGNVPEFENGIDAVYSANGDTFSLTSNVCCRPRSTCDIRYKSLQRNELISLTSLNTPTRTYGYYCNSSLVSSGVVDCRMAAMSYLTVDSLANLDLFSQNEVSSDVLDQLCKKISSVDCMADNQQSSFEVYLDYDAKHPLIKAFPYRDILSFGRICCTKTSRGSVISC